LRAPTGHRRGVGLPEVFPFPIWLEAVVRVAAIASSGVELRGRVHGSPDYNRHRPA